MDADRARRLREVFDQALDAPASERDAVLRRLAGDDDALRAEATGLIAAFAAGGERFERGPVPDALLARAVAELDPDALLARATAEPAPTDTDDFNGSRIGPYVVDRLIGRGGMGDVYLARRGDGEFDRRVAIKLIKAGMDSGVVVRRFRQERQILAGLNHPNIAVLLDGGVTDDGRPYLAMEYVEGEPITRWCAARDLPVAERVRLFNDVCNAVHFAHQNLVVHRDLKPANILVTADGTAKLLDFGIAKLIDPTGEDHHTMTELGGRALTPSYASPEQVRGETVTTASDVYSLGVILYELLAGRRPFAVEHLSLAEAIRVVSTEEPLRPSAKLALEPTQPLRRAARRNLRRDLERDLDNIVLMAMHKDPSRRYSSAHELAEDLRRFRAGNPVLARGDSVGYRFAKFLRRNRIAATAAGLALLALSGGVVATSVMARRAQAAQERSEQVGAFLRELLSSVRPVTGGRDVPVSELLDSAAVRLGPELTGRPDVRAELEAVLGTSYQALGRMDDAERHFRHAVELRRRLHGPHGAATATALSNLGWSLLQQGRHDAADSVLAEALAARGRRRARPDTVLASVLSNLGSVAHARSQPAEAERLHREALAIRRRLLAPEDPRLAVSLNNLAVSLGEQNRWDEAEPLHREVVTLLRANDRNGGGLMVADALNSLATALDLQGKHAGADSAYRETLLIRRSLMGAEHPNYAFTAFNYASFLFDLGQYEKAAQLSREILALRGRTVPDSHPAIAAALQTLGRCLDRLGDHAAAEAALIESLELRRRHTAPGSWLVANSEGMLGEHYAIVGNFARAERLLLGADERLSEELGADSARTLMNVRRIVALYETWGRPDDAARYRARLGE